MYQAAKPKSIGKISIPHGPGLSGKVLSTLEKTATIVGGTLGPFGRQILLEHPDASGKPFATKDGVTVFKHLGYHDSIEQVVLEAARDAVVRTAQEAGDGTTTATILSYAITKYANDLCTKSRNLPPQRIIRAINSLIPDIVSWIKEKSYLVDSDNYSDLLLKVATLSANGDEEMAKIILDCFDLVGEEGNITISEEYGLSGYNVEKFDGFTIDRGYEESCQNFYSAFINDPGNNRIFLQKPIYVLFDGQVNEPSTIAYPLQLIGAHYENNPESAPSNIVVMAHSFSKSVIGWLAHNFLHAPVKVVPLTTTQTVVLNSQAQQLHDMAAFTGAKVYNPLSAPLQQCSYEELTSGTSEAFESGRYRSTIIGMPDASAVELRVEELKQQMTVAESTRDRMEIEVRVAKLTCGIAKVKVVGPSQIEIRERKDRAEDAWCAIRSASKYGALPGGGWTLIHLSRELEVMAGDAGLPSDKRAACKVLSGAFLEPVRVLYTNAGYTIDQIAEKVIKFHVSPNMTFDLQNDKWVSGDSLLDSAAAVLEAIRNSISISTLLGTLGGVVVFKRDGTSDVADSKDLRQFLKDVEEGDNPEYLEEDLF